jgi:hypothetical protein
LNVRVVLASCLAALAGIGAAVAVSACQSSQAKNRELAKKGATILKQEKGLTVSQTSSAVKVLNTAVLSDANGAAVVVTLKNESSQALMNVPIAINVKDAKGKSVFKNDSPGLAPALTSVPQMLPSQTVDWVDDQILATGTPKSVDVKVGVTQSTLPPNPPQVEASPPKLKVDPVSGIQAEGTVTDNSPIQQVDVTLFAVARKGGKVVAAGRGGIKTIAPNGGSRPYHIYFIGNPKGAQVTVTAPPSTFN